MKPCNSPNSQPPSTFMTLQRCKQVKITITLNQLEGAILTRKINDLNRWKAGECLCKAAFSAAFPEELFKELKTFHFMCCSYFVYLHILSSHMYILSLFRYQSNHNERKLVLCAFLCILTDSSIQKQSYRKSLKVMKMLD